MDQIDLLIHFIKRRNPAFVILNQSVEPDNSFLFFLQTFFLQTSVQKCMSYSFYLSVSLSFCIYSVSSLSPSLFPPVCLLSLSLFLTRESLQVQHLFQLHKAFKSVNKYGTSLFIVKTGSSLPGLTANILPYPSHRLLCHIW